LYTSINGIKIDGLEYWPFDDSIEGSPYPERVLWKFELGSKEAKACMLKSSTLLTSWLEDTHSPVYEKLKELKRRGGPSQFWMWTNDYTKAPVLAASVMRRAHVWHWCSEPSTPDCGWLKFESTVGPDGVCKMPEAQEVSNFLQSRINLLPEPLQPEGSEDSNLVDSDRGVPRGDVSESNPRETAINVGAGKR
jgi:hypothetical protein